MDQVRNKIKTSIFKKTKKTKEEGKKGEVWRWGTGGLKGKRIYTHFLLSFPSHFSLLETVKYLCACSPYFS